MNSTKRRTAQVALLTLAGFFVPASAFQPLVTDDTGTQGSGGNQLEFSLNADRATAAGNTERLRTLPIVYTRGLMKTLDVFAGLRHTRIRSRTPGGDASGSGNPTLGAKWRFFESEESKTGFALKPEVLLPIGAGREGAGLGAGKSSGSLTLILTQEVSFGAIHVNAGAGRERHHDTLKYPDTTTTRLSVAPVWELSAQWKLAFDLGTESARARGATLRSSFLELGTIYSPQKHLDFALGILRSSGNENPRATKHTATAGITWRFL